MDFSDLTDGIQRIRLDSRIPGAAVDQDTRKELETISNELNVSMSQVNRLAIRHFLKEYKALKQVQQKG